MTELLLIAGGLALAAAAQSLTGFGFALVAVPLLSVGLGAQLGVATVIIVEIIFTAAMVAQDFTYVRWRDAAFYSMLGCLGVPLGVWMLLVTPEAIILAVIGGVVVLAVAIRECTLPPVEPLKGRTRVIVGISSGALLGSVGMNGPPLVIAVTHQRLPHRVVRGTLSLIFMLQGLAAGVLLLVQGLGVGVLRSPAVWLSFPLMGLGWWLGDVLSRRLSESSLHRVGAVLLLACGLWALGQALIRIWS